MSRSRLRGLQFGRRIAAIMANVIDGKSVAAALRVRVAAAAAGFSARVGRPPGLDVVLVGDDPASQVYVRNKGCLLYTSDAADE